MHARASAATVETVNSGAPSGATALGVGLTLAGAGVGALIARRDVPDNDPMKNIGTAGGAAVGASVVGIVGGAMYMMSQRTELRRFGRAAGVTALSSLGLLLTAGLVVSALTPGAPSANPLPGPPFTMGWTQIPVTTTLQPQVLYRLSDNASPSDLQSPPTVADLQAYLGPAGFQIDDVWTTTPPLDWPRSDVAGRTKPRIYMQFMVTKVGAQLPGLTSDASLLVQKAAV